MLILSQKPGREDKVGYSITVYSDFILQRWSEDLIVKVVTVSSIFLDFSMLFGFVNVYAAHVYASVVVV